MELITIDGGTALIADETRAKIVEFETVIKKLKEQEDALKSAILAEMEAKNIVKIDAPDLSITYIAPTDRETFDSKAFRAEHGDLYDEYVRMTPVKSQIRLKVK